MKKINVKHKKMLKKALQIQAELSVDGRSIFDITADCEDGAPAGREREHAEMIAGLILSAENRFGRIGVRIHDVRHPVWRDELDIVISRAGQRVAYIVLPKPENAKDVAAQIVVLDELRKRHVTCILTVKAGNMSRLSGLIQGSRIIYEDRVNDIYVYELPRHFDGSTVTGLS